MSKAPTDRKVRPKEVWDDLIAFSRSAQRFSESELFDQYHHQWVAVREGKVVSHAETFDEVLNRIRTKNIPREDLIIRYLDDSPKALIL